MKQAAWDAVIFDYGGMLCYAPARQDVAECAACSGLDEATFYKLYTATRQYYGLAAAAYKAHWHRVAKVAGITILEAAVRRSIDRESHLWTRANPETLALAREAKAAGSKIAVLSNVASELLEILPTSSIGSMSGRQDLVLREGCAKPDEVIYRTCLQQLECAPDKSLLFDDRPQNVEAARRVGIDAHVFESAGQARAIAERGRGRPEEGVASEK